MLPKPTLTLLLLLLSFLATCGGAEAAPVDDLEDPVWKGSAVTYLSLVNAVVKVAGDDAEGGRWVTSSEKVLRRIGEKGRTVVPAGSPLGGFQAVTLRGDGRRYLLLCWEAEGDFSDVPYGGAFFLAVFPEGSAEPTDVADVKTDRFTDLSDGAAPPLGPDDAFALTNSHGNSNQGYLISDLFHIHGGRLRRIASVLTLSVSGLCERSFREGFAWGSEGDPGNPYPKVIATVTLERGPLRDEGEDCPGAKGPPHRESCRETTRWDKAKGRYGPPDRGLEKLDRFNRKNF